MWPIDFASGQSLCSAEKSRSNGLRPEKERHVLVYFFIYSGTCTENRKYFAILNPLIQIILIHEKHI